MKRFAKSLVGVVACAAFLLAGCGERGGPGGEIQYPDFPRANAETDSWLQRDESDGITDINWFVEGVGWRSDMLSGNSWVARRIREKTGVNVNFLSPLDTTGSQLNALIASDKLPDVVTVNCSSLVQRQLSEEGYLYPIQGLAERWAPSLLPRIDEEICDYFAASDGYLYGLPNNFYTHADLDAYWKQGGLINCNGGLVVRKDYLEWYLNDAVEQGTYNEYIGKKLGDYTIPDARAAAEYGVTLASNFLDMCKAVKAHFEIPNSEQTIMLSPWEPTQVSTGSRGIRWLYEYFNVKFETAEGDFSNRFKDPRLKELTDWLNRAYRENIITNLGLQSSQVNTALRSGKAFCFIGSTQDYTSSFARWNFDHPSSEYVPVIITNDEGETPQISSLAGPGYRFSMITRNCKRPDKVIKLFDYLWSDEGQRLVWYGYEGSGASDQNATYYETQAPNETYKYGQIAYTDWFAAKLGTGESTADVLGAGSMNLLASRMYSHMVHERGAYLPNYLYYIEYNLKAAIHKWTYTSVYQIYHDDFGYSLFNTSDKQYNKYVTRQTQINDLWFNDYLIRVIKAGSEAASTRLFNEAVGYVDQYGYQELYNWLNTEYHARKEKYDMDFVHPSNRADSGYADLYVTSIFGDPSARKEIPAGITYPA